ncbi:sensor histidine kinase [Pseudomonas sp. LRF_L74]|uniref:sensor histidine kinase n=1 Tax=Pseudomonas sp. LRF_L74 TaxID=3369422 RepID=UPI003F648AED
MTSRDEGCSRTAVSKFEEAMLAATPDCIKVITPDGVLLAINAAGRVALGLTTRTAEGTPWISLLPPSVHASAYEALSQAASGSPARFAGYSEGDGATIYWDNLLTPVTDEQGGVASIICVSRNVTEQILLKRELDKSLERERLLSREMLHRINNIFSVVGAVVSMSEKEAFASGDSAGLARIVAGKLGALARSYQAILSSANTAAVDLKSILDSVLTPFSGQCRIDGHAQLIAHEISSAIALCIHELATNAVKHGALSTAQGEVRLSWDAADGYLDLNWTEVGGPSVLNAPEKSGFGSTLIDRLGRSIGATVTRNWLAEGLRIGFRFPVDK